MRIKIKADGKNLWIPVPLGMVGLILRCMPEKVFLSKKKDVAAPYDVLVSKEAALLLWGELREALAQCKGLEIVHVEAKDGTFVSLKI